MLNKYWEKVYDPKDLDLWAKLNSTAPPVVYPFQKQILYSLLAKYYRTNKGNSLHPDNPKHSLAFLEMLKRTMDELQMAIFYKEKRDEEQWYEERDKYEDLGAKLTREDELKRDSSISCRRVPNPIRRNFDYGISWQERFNHGTDQCR